MTENKIDHADVTSVLLAHSGWVHVVPGTLTLAADDRGWVFDTCRGHYDLPPDAACIGSPTRVFAPGNLLGFRSDPDRLAKHHAALAVTA